MDYDNFGFSEDLKFFHFSTIHDVQTNKPPYNTTSNSVHFVNNTLNSDQEQYEDDLDIQLFQEYSTTLLRFASICCILFMMVGIPGNLITIIALFRCKKVINLILSINYRLVFIIKIYFLFIELRRLGKFFLQTYKFSKFR